MNKDKQELPKIAKLTGFNLSQKIQGIQTKDRKNRNKVEIEIYNTMNK